MSGFRAIRAQRHHQFQTPHDNIQLETTPTQQQKHEQIWQQALKFIEQCDSGQQQVFNDVIISDLSGVATNNLAESPTES